MVAFALVCGLSAGALTSLNIKHLDLENKVFVQDAGDIHTRYDINYRAAWFPRTDDFRSVFLEWVQELKHSVFQAEDAEFPAIKERGPRLPDAPAVEILASGRALQTAFSRASEPLGKRYMLHSARHTLKALGARICRKHEE